MLLYDPVYRTNIIESTFHYYTAQTMKEVTVSLYTLIVRMYNFFTCNLQKRKFMVLIEDDINYIHAKHHPKSSVTSTIWHTVPCKCKLTVSTRNSILDARSYRGSSIEVRGSSIEYRVSRHLENFSRISIEAFEETFNFSNLKQ